jgi:membrane fusion protein, multidrug efflux system
VLTKAAQVDPGSATADVRIAFTRKTAFTAGMTLRVEIVAEERPKALIVPAAALVDDEGDLFVMVAGDDNKAHRFPVAIGLTTRAWVEVTSGLKAGDRVIVRGQDGLPEGAVITVESK